jgi:hypothetical protein
MIRAGWRGLQAKADFTALQVQDPVLLAMGREEQAKLVLRAGE